MRQPAIEVRGLTKRFGANTAVDDLSFQVRGGVVTGFLGPNGAGKTTTIRMVLGLIRPTSGEAWVMGEHFVDLADPAHRVGVLLDGAGTHPSRTGRNHLRVLSAERGIDGSRVDEVLRVVELDREGHRRVGEYSLGMRQRLDLAATLLGEPEILILDEPANGLDPAGIHWLRDFLRTFAANGGTVFVSSHQLAELSQVADEVVVINRGRLVTHTTVAALTAARSVRVRAREVDRLRRALAATGAAVREVDAERIDVSDLAIEQVGETAAREGIVLYELVSRANTLEDVFLELTAEGAAT
ncbi:MAG: ABC transporter ATP-binding protein [Actinomycetota bacterium]|nr:ABC transporter ATP-binding protein [Actinomycetota bacterium]